MAKIFAKFLLKSTYKSVYGNKAIIKISDDIIEVVSGNKKIIHDKESSNKIEETFYEENKVRIIKYDANGKAELEETFVNGEKISEKVLGDGKSTKVDVNQDGLETSKSIYIKDNIECEEVLYKYHNKATDFDYEVLTISNEKEIIKKIIKKKNNENLVDVQKKCLLDGRIVYYKSGNVEIEIEYFGETKAVKRYSKHWEEPIFDEINQTKNKKNNKDNKEEKQQVGTKIKKEIIEYNKNGSILYLENDKECIHREFDEEGNLKKQYNIIDGKRGKEIVGKIITEDKDIKIINNSTLSNDLIVKLNEDMDILEFKFEDNLVKMCDFMFWNGGIEITDEYYQINSKFDLKKRAYDKIEDNVDYHIEETYKNNKLYATRIINNLSKTELYVEGNRYFIKGFNGIEKEITEEEFKLYKKADALNKI